MNPGPRPGEPFARFAVPADHGKAEKILEATAVDPDADHLGTLDQRVEVQAGTCRRLPEVRADPSVGAKREADLEVQVLRGPSAEFVLAGRDRGLEVLDQARDRNRPAGVRRHELPMLRVFPLVAVLADRVRQFVQDRQHRAAVAPIAHGAGLREFGLEHAHRRPVALRRDEGEECLGEREHPAADLADRRRRLRHFRDHVQFVDQRAAGDFLPGQDVRVEGHDFEGRAGLAVRDRLEVLPHVHLFREHRVELDRAAGRLEGNFGDVLHGRRHYELRRRPGVEQERREHHERAVRRFRVLLRDEEEQLPEPPLARHRVDRAEHRAHDDPEPLAARLAHPRRPGNVGQAQHIERAHRAIARGDVYRQALANRRLTCAEFVLPIGARKIAGGHCTPGGAGARRTSSHSVPAAAVFASSCATAFLPGGS